MVPITPPKASYAPGEEIDFKCIPGYKRITPLLHTITTCQPNNTWAPDLQEACEVNTCPKLEEPLNGQIVYVAYVNTNKKFGSQAYYMCNEGYYIVGEKNRYCELTGRLEWSGVAPHCARILCQPPPQIPNGEFSNSDKDVFEYSDVVTYHCIPSNGPDDFSLVGENKLTCSGRNKWRPDPPVCKVVKCQPPVLEDGRVVSGLEKKLYYKAEVTIKCERGFYLEGSKTLFCGANNNWEPALPKCIKGACDELPTFTTMKLKGDAAPHYAPGDTIEYECLPGYKHLVPILPTSTVCETDNTWSPLEEACTKKLCPPLADVQNAQVFYTHGTFQFGSETHYTCNEGYRLIGANILYCNLSGDDVEWSDNPPQCEMVKCEIPVVENGRLVSGHEKVYHYQAKADLECLEGFDLQGSSRITCGPNNDWEPQIPTCIKGDFPEVEFQNLENVHPANQVTPPPVTISTPGSVTLFLTYILKKFSQNRFDETLNDLLFVCFYKGFIVFTFLTSFVFPGKPSANSTPPPKDNKEYGGGLIALMVLQQVLALQ
ncbi:membrane cofactor protein-like [Pipistrellus kuhlii]|uniref:membrane cofactor protein-like n=1 Tax=Pipistrellus kuhlii TaxID=59472 RepID=UPI001E270C0D|nr:membrane cofactor protein-like [Pipistrellus kuhlii]